jgi:hypothetical protein
MNERGGGGGEEKKQNLIQRRYNVIFYIYMFHQTIHL